MLTPSPLDSLHRLLNNALESLNIRDSSLGQPELLRKAVDEVKKVFQGYASARPSTKDAYAAALAFMRGKPLDEHQRHLVASALSMRIKEQDNACALGHPNLPSLIEAYNLEAERGELWRLTWFGLLGSYFSFDPLKASEAEQGGWIRLRAFLQRTWPLIDRQSSGPAVPDWVLVLRKDPDLISDKAAHRHALDYLRGNDTAVKKLSADLAIPESSWFWHALVLSAVRRCTEQSDERFKASIPHLLKLISARPVYRDEALELLLTRYHRCVDVSVHPQLRDYVCRKDVWRNPKLRDAGSAPAWNRVDDAVWRMVMQWVNTANLRDFFELLAARRQADEGRLEFWSQYIEQISWTRLIFSSQTRMLAHSNEGVRNLIAREEGSYATMSANADVDAFMMQLGSYLVVEFSKVPNAAYVYKADELPFEPYSREYAGTGEDLKHGFRNECAARFIHTHGWEENARYELLRLGIFPDRAAEDGAHVGARFTMSQLRKLVEAHPGAAISDRRSPSGGRLWVEDPKQRVELGNELMRLGFKWASSRQAWYYPES